MSDMQIFSTDDFSLQLYQLDENLDSWFFADDLAGALGYGRTRDMVNRLVSDTDKMTVNTVRDPRIGAASLNNHIVINESGLYSVILGSKKPQTEKFKQWVTGEVLPTIRKTGAYNPNSTAVAVIDAPRRAEITLTADNRYDYSPLRRVVKLAIGQHGRVTLNVGTEVIEAMTMRKFDSLFDEGAPWFAHIVFDELTMHMILHFSQDQNGGFPIIQNKYGARIIVKGGLLPFRANKLPGQEIEYRVNSGRMALNFADYIWTA